MQPQSSMRSSTSMHERESNDGASDGSNSTRRREDSISTSINGSSTSNKKRKKNATMACNTCRRKRNRCIVDEGASVCRGCKASGQDCQFAEFDKRRDGIQGLREKLSFYESMFETLQSGSNSQRSTLHNASSAAAAASAAVDQSMQDNHRHLESFDFLSNSNHNNSNAFPGSSSSSNALGNANNASTSAFFEQANNGTSDASAVLARTPQSTVASRQLRESPRKENNGLAPTGSSSLAAANNGDAYEGSAHPHSQRIGSHPSTHRRVSARTPDMLAVMDHLAVESNGLIRAYGATSETALAGFEDLPSQKTVYNTRRYLSDSNSKEPPREVTPPADIQPLQSSALAAAAANISALPL